tara:strand:- start:844 stop:1110 length:267 start_codon:yes stop_codon:yes gene_type:complete
MKLFKQMKTNEREMLLSMLANNTESNMKLLVEQAFDEGNEFTFRDVLDLADYFGSRWGIDFRSICFKEAVKYDDKYMIQYIKTNGWKK